MTAQPDLLSSRVDDAVDIRPAGWRDLAEVRALERACFGPDAWSWVELLFALIGPNVRLKAVIRGQLVGFVVGEMPPLSDSAWIATLGVLPEYQRRGVGARLLAEIEARLPAPRLKLTVRRSNAPALALYQKFGYAPVGQHERYYSDGEAGIVMEKRRR